MKNTIAFLTMVILFWSCNGQDQAKELQENKKDSLSEKFPEGSWTVNKEFDEDGNLIRMDSTYTYSWSSDGKALSSEEMDSLMTDFRKYFDLNFGSRQSFFKDLEPTFPFEEDTTGWNSFFERGFFERNEDLLHERMNEMIKRADSLHREFFEQQARPKALIEKQKEI